MNGALKRPSRRFPKRSLRVVAGAALVLIVLFGLAVIAFRIVMIERYFLYLPAKELTSNPSHYGIPFEEVWLTTSDGKRLHGWFMPGTSDVTVLWLHGNAGNIGDRVGHLKLLRDYVGAHQFIFDYRGYGKSEGSPSEKGMYRDAQAALEYLRSRKDLDTQCIVYLGHSLGAAVAAELALHQAPHRLILEAPFPSIPYMARDKYPYLPIWWLLRTKFDTEKKVREVKAPTLVIHGTADDIIPLKAGRRVYEAASDPKELYIIEGAGHNDIPSVGGQAYLDKLQAFIAGPGK